MVLSGDLSGTCVRQRSTAHAATCTCTLRRVDAVNKHGVVRGRDKLGLQVHHLGWVCERDLASVTHFVLHSIDGIAKYTLTLGPHRDQLVPTVSPASPAILVRTHST